MSDLAEFLLARIAEDEAVARAVGQTDPWTRQGLRYRSDFDSAVGEGDDAPFAWTAAEEVAEHIARHDPDRVLAECEAKRRIVEAARHTLFDDPFRRTDFWRGARDAVEGDLRFLALPYADHEDYRQEWRP